MTAASRYLTRQDVEEILAPYGGHFLEAPFLGVEVWGAGGGVEFSLSLEMDGVHYDEWMISEAIEKAIKPTLPSDWLLGELLDDPEGDPA